VGSSLVRHSFARSAAALSFGQFVSSAWFARSEYGT